jgi:hypothetical protein
MDGIHDNVVEPNKPAKRLTSISRFVRVYRKENRIGGEGFGTESMSILDDSQTARAGEE